MMILGVATILSVYTIAIASAQGPNTTATQDGSVIGNTNVTSTTLPAINAPPPVAIPNGAASPVVAAAITQTPLDANSSTATDTSASFGGDITPPAIKKPKRDTDMSTPIPVENSSAFVTMSTTGALVIAGLTAGLAVLV